MKQLFCVIYILMFLVCSQTHLHSLYLFLLFWRANQLNSKNRRRFVPYLGHFGYLMRLSRWFGLVSVYCPSCPTNDKRSCPLREGRWQNGRQKRRPWRPLLFLLRRFWELTNTFVLKYFSLLRILFDRDLNWEKRCRTSFLLSFHR